MPEPYCVHLNCNDNANCDGYWRRKTNQEPLMDEMSWDFSIRVGMENLH